jgi:hypothetical protein
MKNKHIERLIASSKRYRKNPKSFWNWDHQRKIRVYHLYDQEKPLSYWDDVSFVSGSQFVTVFWVHPRTDYSDAVFHSAYTKVKSEESFSERKFESTPNYIRLGKNKKRKKIVSYTVKTDENSRETFKKILELEKTLRKTSDISIEASFKVEQYNRYRGASICCPIEVRNVDDLYELAQFVRKCLVDPTLFEKTYGGYKYTKEDYMKENDD